MRPKTRAPKAKEIPLQISQYFDLHDVRVDIPARAPEAHKLRHILEYRAAGIRRGAFAQNPRNSPDAIQDASYVPARGQANLPVNIRHMKKQVRRLLPRPHRGRPLP